jgi:predicted alpha/beta-fold hydrolase
MATWSIESYCAAQQPSDWTSLHAQSQSFLEALNLDRIHPFCSENAPNPYDIPGIPSQGPLQTYDHLETAWDMVVTFIAMVMPALVALGELWLRLSASVIAPLGIAHLLWNVLEKKTVPMNKRGKTILSIVCLLSVASSVVILTDTLYVLEFGPRYGATLLVASCVLSLWTAVKHKLYRTIMGHICLLVLMVYLIYDYETGQFQFGHPDDVVRISEGLYYDSSNSFTRSIVDHWPESYRTYSVEHGATPWMPTGDSRTGLPFLLCKVDDPTWTRVWLSVDDGEVVAIDISFPETGHDTSKPLYLILHGLNGGSQEEYVKDFSLRRTAEGSTVCVMVARGLMDLPVRGWDVFHGARWTDAHSAAKALRAGLGEGQILAGVGFSMGAIILSNYVARSGTDCALDTAVAISGGLDMRYETDFYRAQRLWQPLLTEELRNTFVVGKWGERVRQRLTKKQMKLMMRATHVSEIDKTAVVAYNGFRDLDHYYSEMSALGDIPMSEHSDDTSTTTGNVDQISIPFCVVVRFLLFLVTASVKRAPPLHGFL